MIRFLMSAFIFVGVGGLTLTTTAQDIKLQDEGASIEEYIKAGDRLFRTGQYYAAGLLYQKVIDKKPAHVYAHFKLAETYRHRRFYVDAARHYKKAADLNTKEYTRALYWLGLMKKNQGKYDEAIKTFEEFLEWYSADIMEYRELAKKEVQACGEAKQMIKDPIEISITNLDDSINHPLSDFGAVTPSPDTLVFSGTKLVTQTQRSKLMNMKVKTDSFYVNRIFQSVKKDSVWQARQQLDIPLQKPTHSIGTPSFGPDKEKLFFSLCHGQGKSRHCAIYVTEHKKGKKWTSPKKLPAPVNGENYSSKNPMIAPSERVDGNILFFSTNRRGGQGKFDIWYCFIDSVENISGLVQMGNQINTSQSEVAPFYNTATSSFYFSSKGKKGLGGFDIFKINGQIGVGWEDTATNVGYPLNSGADDYYFTSRYKPADSMQVGYFTSNRSGGHAYKSKTCCDDIYYFERPLQPEKDTSPPLTSADTAGVDTARQTANTELAQAEQEMEADTTVKPSSAKEQPPSSKNKASKTKTKTKSMTAKGKATKKVRVVKEMQEALSTVDTFEKTPIQASPPELQLPTIYYGFNQHTLNPESRKKLDRLAKDLKEHPEITLIVEGHTDNVDKNMYNVILSEKRAKSPMEYLLKQGIERKRIVPQWYGEESPIAANQTENGNDNPAGRAKNRRAEFHVAKNPKKVESGQMVALSKEVRYTLEVLLACGTSDKTVQQLQQLEGVRQVETQNQQAHVSIGPLKNINKAQQLQQVINEKGWGKPIIVPYYKGEKISLLKAFKLMAQEGE